MQFQRVMLDEQPFQLPKPGPNWGRGGVWPAQWICVPNTPAPVVAAYRLEFSIDKPENFRIHLSADERYDLFLNGERVGRGPERGDIEHWSFETYDLELPAGTHTFVARVWSLGEAAAFAQFSVHHGFLFCPENEELQPKLATGLAPWTGKILSGYEWLSPLCAWGTGHNVRIDGREFAWNHESGAGEGWGEVETLWPGARSGSQVEITAYQRLAPASLPPMMDEIRRGFRVRHVSDGKPPTSEIPIRAADNITEEITHWQALLGGEKSIEIPVHTARRVLVDLENYFCARPELVLSGGRDAVMRVHWAESLFENFDRWDKGRRGEIEGKFFSAHGKKKDGVGDHFIADGGQNRRFEPLWWQAGRYLEITVETGDNPLVIENFALRETRYPLENEAQFSCSDARLKALEPIMIRALQMCAHETYMDCPYFEQLMYVGDTRLEVLVTYTLTRDEALPRKALRLFDWSRLHSGLTQSRYPSRVRQIIPPFSLWWVAMCHDYALWRGDPDFTRSLLPGVRAVCDYFASLIRPDGILDAPDGWNFTDWVVTTDTPQKYDGGDPSWKNGVPPTGETQPSGILGWQAAWVFKMAGDLESWFGEPEISELQARRAKSLADALHTYFWSEERGLFADDLGHEHWSEHAQCLSILSGLLDSKRSERVTTGLFENPDLARTTIYFAHYFLETCRTVGRMDKFWEKLDLWFGLVENDLKTTIEMPEPTRSDCHAWGAHPLFHIYATLAGIRPTAPGFSRVEIKPQLSQMRHLDATMPHPRGEIRVVATGDKEEFFLPEGVKLL
ncbi:MAG: alpha-L-rhamnosidase [Armatimonadetes bacterium]|nr:alpha-L-rhamnosidase [Armatimonadota bacterium]